MLREAGENMKIKMLILSLFVLTSTVACADGMPEHVFGVEVFPVEKVIDTPKLSSYQTLKFKYKAAVVKSGKLEIRLQNTNNALKLCKEKECPKNDWIIPGIIGVIIGMIL